MFLPVTLSMRSTASLRSLLMYLMIGQGKIPPKQAILIVRNMHSDTLGEYLRYLAADAITEGCG